MISRMVVRVEVLIPDFRGSIESLRVVAEAHPDVLAHNIETVPRLYSVARAGSRYQRSVDHLRNAKSFGFSVKTKSSLMLGLGEYHEEIVGVLHDLRKAEVDILTLGQYLQPTREHLPVSRYYTPREFIEYREFAHTLGFRYVASGPLVRSSYKAEQLNAESAP
jgi:lipoic acid synthetase